MLETWELGHFGITQKEKQILEVLTYLQGFNQYYIVKIMEKVFGMAPSTTKYILKKLERKGIIIKRGEFYYLT